MLIRTDFPFVDYDVNCFINLLFVSKIVAVFIIFLKSPSESVLVPCS